MSLTPAACGCSFLLVEQLCSALRARVYSAHASSLRLRSAGAHFVRRPVGLASALRASDWCLSQGLLKNGERPAKGGQAVRSAKMRSRRLPA